MSLLALSKVTQWFEEGRLILDEVDLDVEPGQLVALLGPSGSGKSSLLNLIGALDKPKTGSIRFDGVEIASLGERLLADYRSECVGFVFQEHHLLPQLTALENVMAPTLCRPWRNRESPEAKALRLLEAVGVTERIRALPGQLSGGERQRVAIARALVNSPKLLLCDEPTGNLDRETVESVVRLLIDLAFRERVAVVMATHNEAHALAFDRRLRIESCKLVEGP